MQNVFIFHYINVSVGIIKRLEEYIKRLVP